MQTVLAKSPLRISFVGGGSDLPDPPGTSYVLGRTISAAINKYVYAFFKKRTDSKVILHWREQREEVNSAEELQHDIIREILLMEGFRHGIEIATFADISGVGSGLGSSAATTAACLACVWALKGRNLNDNPNNFAESVCDIEISRLKKACGRQDQYASVFGGVLDIQYENSKVSGIDSVCRDDKYLKMIPKRFALFSPSGSDNGRQSDPILADRKITRGWREKCNALCGEFIKHLKSSLFLGLDEWDNMFDLVWQHNKHKIRAFHRFSPTKTREAFDRLESLGVKFKLCGAGGTGHLFVGLPISKESRSIIQAVESIWGKQVKWEVSTKGTMVWSID